MSIARTSNLFTNPATGATYSWVLNHESEDEFGKARQVEVTFNTGDGMPIRQQANSEPMNLRLTGRALTEAHITELWRWFVLCENQTIYFRDFAGDEYEVQITDFKPRRQRAVLNMRDLANAPLHTWSYVMEMHVYRLISGPAFTAGVET